MSEEKEIPEQITSTEKWLIAVLIGLLFLILCSPIIFNFSNSLFSKIRFPLTDSRGVPTNNGWIVHMIIFIILLRVLMR